MTPEAIARVMVFLLIADEEWTTPQGVKAYTYFQEMEPHEANKAFQQIMQLPRHDRMSDITYRMEVDRATAG